MQEDIIGITDSSYNLVCSYEYDSWGKLISIKDNNNNVITNPSHIGYINPFRYRSYYYDNETELYYLNSRYYNPEWGRFISIDIYLGITGDILGYNLYLYASNNPINNSDDEGRFFKKAWNWVKKKASQAAKKVSKVVSKVVKKVKSVVNKVAKKVEQIYTKAKDSFVFEAEVGFGFGGGINVGPASMNAGFNKTIGYGYNNGESYQYTTNSIGIDAGYKENKIGLSFELKNIDNGNGNPMSMPWEVWNDESTIKDITFGVKRDIHSNGNIMYERSKDTKFIGISFELFFGLGGKIKIGFNI